MFVFEVSILKHYLKYLIYWKFQSIKKILFLFQQIIKIVIQEILNFGRENNDTLRVWNESNLSMFLFLTLTKVNKFA